MADDRSLTGTVPQGIGVDIGSSLAKLCWRAGEALEFAIFPLREEGAIAQAVAAAPGPIALTGAGASRWQRRLDSRTPQLVSEFEATARGVALTLSRHGLAAPESYLVASIGTGTSILRIGSDGVSRVGGTALGGGTLIGLGELLCGTGDYRELVALAATGNRQTVDLLVRDVYPDGIEALPGELTAANFGCVRSGERADLANALCGLLGENLGLLCGGLARLHAADTVFYCGTALLDNQALGNILIATTFYAGALGRVLPDGAFCGALGALGHLGC